MSRRYPDSRVPRGTSRRWEVVLADDEDQERHGSTVRALDVRSEHRTLRELDEDDLARIPLLPQDERLVRYKAYLDLHDPARADFLAEGTEVVKPGQRIVAKTDVPRDVWDRLVEACHTVVGWKRRRSA